MQKDLQRPASETILKYIRSINERILEDVERISWSITELLYFSHLVFYWTGKILSDNPIKLPSGQYEEKLKAEKTQMDLIKEMAQELSSLPRFTAWTKTINEKGKVCKARASIYKVDIDSYIEEIYGKELQKIFKYTHESCCTKRDLIEFEISARQFPWTKSGTAPPPVRASAEKAASGAST